MGWPAFAVVASICLGGVVFVIVVGVRESGQRSGEWLVFMGVSSVCWE